MLWNVLFILSAVRAASHSAQLSSQPGMIAALTLSDQVYRLRQLDRIPLSASARVDVHAQVAMVDPRYRLRLVRR